MMRNGAQAALIHQRLTNGQNKKDAITSLLMTVGGGGGQRISLVQTGPIRYNPGVAFTLSG